MCRRERSSIVYHHLLQICSTHTKDAMEVQIRMTGGDDVKMIGQAGPKDLFLLPPSSSSSYIPRDKSQWFHQVWNRPWRRSVSFCLILQLLSAVLDGKRKDDHEHDDDDDDDDSDLRLLLIDHYKSTSMIVEISWWRSKYRIKQCVCEEIESGMMASSLASSSSIPPTPFSHYSLHSSRSWDIHS